MRIRNPSFVHPVAAFIASKRGAVQAFIASHKGETISFEEIREALPAADRAAATDDVLIQMLHGLGHLVER